MSSSSVQRPLDVEKGHAVAVVERGIGDRGVVGQDIQPVVVVAGIATRRFHELQALGSGQLSGLVLTCLIDCHEATYTRGGPQCP